MCIFFDYRKAFDTIHHRRLMKRLSELNVHPLLLSWICSYLNNRYQHVVNSSSFLQVLSVVPQSSVLGPLLFLTVTPSPHTAL